MISGLCYDILFLMPLSVAVMSLVYKYIEPFKEEPVISNGWLIITIVTVILILLVKHLGRRGRAVIAGVLLSFMLAVWIFMPSGERLDIIREHLWILREIMAVIGVMLVGEVAERYKWLRAVLSAAGVILAVTMLFWGAAVTKISVCTIILFTMLTVSDVIQRYSKKEGDTGYKKHLVAISPFILIIFMVSMLLTTPERPYDWRITRRLVQLAKSEWIMLSETFFTENVWDGGAQIIGFSDRSSVGGDISASDRTVMEMRTQGESDPKVYLVGKTFDTFDGHNWDKQDNSATDERLFDTIETMSAVLEAVEEDASEGAGILQVSDFVKMVVATVSYKDMHTKCLFMPSKYMQLDGGNRKISSEGQDFLFENKRSARDPYQVTYYRLNRDNEVFEKLVSGQESIDRERFDETKEHFGIVDDVTFDDYLEYRDMLYKYYLPETEISPELKSRVDEALEGADSDYEKLQLLQGLFGSFKYTNTPGDIPDSVKSGADFLDYFMLETREGYCSYYASAFVLLARAYGIPARYVQGFSIPVGKSRKTEVNSNMAHAWAEAYVDGLGWLTFEPTPGMLKEVSWAVSTPKEESAEETEEETEERDYFGDLDEETEEEVVEEKTPAFTLHWYQVTIPLLAGVLFTLLIFAIDRLLRSRRYARMNERSKAAWMCRSYMDFLKRRHLQRGSEETLSEYRQRLDGMIPGEYLAFIDIYEDILYSERDISEDERMDLENRFKELRKYLRFGRRSEKEAG